MKGRSQESVCIVAVVVAIILVPAVRLVAAEKPSRVLTPQKPAQAWTLLFDGKSLKGWDARPTSKPGTTGDWTVANGAIVCPGSTPGWLSTSDTFSNFVLNLEFRGQEKVNSGIFIRSQKAGEPHRTGHEVQIWDYQPAGFTTGSLVGTAKAAEVRILPGQWNRLEITADADRYTVVLNGKTLLDTRDNTHTSGVIGLQCQPDNRIEFRNLRLRPIKDK